MPENLLEALILVGIPAVVGAINSYYARRDAKEARKDAKEARRQLTPSNGERVAQIVEKNSQILQALGDSQHRLAQDFDSHLADAKAHYKETHQHCIGGKDGVCSTCGTIVEGD